MARGEVSALVSARSALILFRERDPLLEELLRRLRELGLEFEEEVVPCG